MEAAIYLEEGRVQRHRRRNEARGLLREESAEGRTANHITLWDWYAEGTGPIKHASFSFLIFAHMFGLLLHLSVHSPSICQAADPVFVSGW